MFAGQIDKALLEFWRQMPTRAREYIQRQPDTIRDKMREKLRHLLRGIHQDDFAEVVRKLEDEADPFQGYWDKPWIVLRQYAHPLQYKRKQREEKERYRLWDRKVKQERPVLEGSSWQMVLEIEERKRIEDEAKRKHGEKQLPPSDRIE